MILKSFYEMSFCSEWAWERSIEVKMEDLMKEEGVKEEVAWAL